MRRGVTKDQPFIPGLSPERQRGAGRAKHKVFLAVKPDTTATGQAEERTLQLMDEYRLAGTPLRTDNLHISLPLIFEGDEVPSGIAETVSARVQAIRMPPFEIILDMAMTFRLPKQHVLVLSTAGSIANIYNLNRQLIMAGGAKATGGAFNPHMSLLYTDQPVRKQLIEPVRWTVREFVLVHSFVGLGRHETMARWPLR
jgi:2'-5' RNA ligase